MASKLSGADSDSVQTDISDSIKTEGSEPVKTEVVSGFVEPAVASESVEPAVASESVDSGLVSDSAMATPLLVSLPSFTGVGSVTRFKDDFSIYASLQGWTVEKQRDVIPLCLSGIARDAYDSFSQVQKGSISTIFTALSDCFSGSSPLDSHLALRDLKFSTSESIDVFVIKLRQLVSRAFPGQPLDGLLFSHFLTALPDEQRAAVVADGVTKFEDAVKKVRNLCSAARVTSTSSSVRQVSADSGFVQQLESRIRELESEVRRLRVQPQPQPRSASSMARGASGPVRPPQGATCHSCGGSSHLRSSCRFRNLTCRQCGRQGHIARVCRGGAPEGNPSALGSGPLPRGAQQVQGPRPAPRQ